MNSCRHHREIWDRNSKAVAARSMRLRHPRRGHNGREDSHVAGGAGGERGAIIVQAAIAMVVLVGFSAFVVDYGVLWLSREQAQDAADAGAMAGAMSRA